MPVFSEQTQTVTESTQPTFSGLGIIISLMLAYPWWRLLLGLGVLGLVIILAVSQGPVRITPIAVIQILLSKLMFMDNVSHWPDTWVTIIWKLRLPRVVLASIVGIALAMSGATYQGLFRNPLADPYLIGVASGAGLGATIVLVTGTPLYFIGISLLPIAAFAGAIGAVTISYLIARQSGELPLTTLILAGIAIAALSTAMTSLIMLRSDPDLRPVLSWLLGGFITAQWKQSLIILPYLVPSLLVILSYGRILNVLQLDEEQSRQLGVNIGRTKLLLISASTLATAAAVSFTGLIGFVGLVAPHAVRLVWGNDYRFLLPMSGILGAVFLILADLVARTIVSPGELPVGVVTAFVGAPFFLYLLRKRKRVLM